jgi:hypothetical protein
MTLIHCTETITSVLINSVFLLQLKLLLDIFICTVMLSSSVSSPTFSFANSSIRWHSALKGEANTFLPSGRSKRNSYRHANDLLSYRWTSVSSMLGQKPYG